MTATEFDFEDWEKGLLAMIGGKIEETLHVIGNKLVADGVKRLKEGDKQAFNNLINSVAYDVMNESPLLWALKFGANAKTDKGEYYAKFVEEGRVPGKLPPYEPILRWSGEKRRKLGNSFFGDMEISQVAKKVQWGMKEKGVEPYPFLSWSMEQNKGFIEERIKMALGL